MKISANFLLLLDGVRSKSLASRWRNLEIRNWQSLWIIFMELIRTMPSAQCRMRRDSPCCITLNRKWDLRRLICTWRTTLKVLQSKPSIPRYGKIIYTSLSNNWINQRRLRLWMESTGVVGWMAPACHCRIVHTAANSLMIAKSCVITGLVTAKLTAGIMMIICLMFPNGTVGSLSTFWNSYWMLKARWQSRLLRPWWPNWD